MSAGRSELWINCKPCRHTWIGAQLPMPVHLAAQVMRRATCPKCGETKQLFMATEAQIREAELVARQRFAEVT